MSSDSIGSLTEDHIEFIAYDLPQYQLSFMFQLNENDRPTAADRVVDINVSFISFPSRSKVNRLVEDWIPSDAKRVGPAEQNDIGESIQEYESKSMSGTIKTIDYPGFDEPGGIWVTYWPFEGDVGVVEISLFYPRAE